MQIGAASTEDRLPTIFYDLDQAVALKEPGRDNTTKSYVWVARGGPPETPVLVYRYEPSRGAWVLAGIIGHYQGYVQTDGYEGYERPCNCPGVVHVGSLAHLRRAFEESADALGRVSNRVGTAHQAVAYIAKLYRIESELSEYRESDPDRFQAERRARAQPVLDKMYGWLRQKQDQVPPSTTLSGGVGAGPIGVSVAVYDRALVPDDYEAYAVPRYATKEFFM
ncbi:MAG: transposase [Caldilineaceae bacterium]|nr:transposase [Caldilineaceae bacterium]